MLVLSGLVEGIIAISAAARGGLGWTVEDRRDAWRDKQLDFELSYEPGPSNREPSSPTSELHATSFSLSLSLSSPP